MALEVLEPRMGRKMAHPGTVRINKGNVLRISADVHLFDEENGHYLPMIDRAKKLVVLVKAHGPGPNVLNTWTSNKKARSPLISATRFLEELGLDGKKALGEYKATKKGDRIIIDFSKKVVKTKTNNHSA